MIGYLMSLPWRMVRAALMVPIADADEKLGISMIPAYEQQFLSIWMPEEVL